MSRTARTHPMRALAIVAVVAVVAAACSSKTTPTIAATGILSFDRNAVFRSNGLLPGPDPLPVCGSDTASFLSGFSGDIASLTKVPFEWADIVKNGQIYASGTVHDVMESNDDFLFAHPFGFDVTADIQLDPAFKQLLPTGGHGVQQPASTLHWEIAQGQAPHAGPASFDLLPGFLPQEGDRVATIGRWIIDCGHPDFHTEIHPPTFVAFAHAQGSSTVAHLFYNPYWITQLYNPDPSLVGDFSNQARLTDPHTKPFPAYMLDEVKRLGHQGPQPPPCCTDHLGTHVLIGANTFAPVSWVVCAPGPKPAGGTLSVVSDLTQRSGVRVTTTEYADQGCVSFRATIGSGFSPAPLPSPPTCTVAWSTLSEEAAKATPGGKSVDIEKTLEGLVPAAYRANAKKPPSYDCYPALQAPPPGGGATGKSATVTDDQQAFPFYGTVTVSWHG